MTPAVLAPEPVPTETVPAEAVPTETVSAETVIDVADVVVEFDGEIILNGVNLRVQRGEFVALIGPSGGGKSTLLRVLAGLLRPVRGRVWLSSAPALVFQDYRLLPWRTAQRNVELPADLGTGGGLPAREALHLVGMTEYASRWPRELSGGMRARVALARALAQSGDILLLDEPFAALDALVRERFNAELRHLHEKTGRTTILVTHSIREAVWLADKVAVLRDGRVVEVLDTRGEGRLSAYTEGPEAHLRGLLGTGDSTHLRLSRPERWQPSHLLPLLAIALGFVGWQLLAARLNQPFLLPTPAAVWHKYLSNAPLLWQSLWVTGSTALLGTLLGGVLGLLLGYPLAKFRALERFLSPYLVASQSTPIVIIAPLLVSVPWLGFGWRSAVFVSALSAFYPLLVAAMVGLREVDRTYYELFCTLRASFWQRLVYLELPGTLPVLLGGLRLSVSLALIGAVVWEFTDPNQKGLGFRVQEANYDKPMQFAAIALLVLFGVLLYTLVTALERWVMRRRG